MRLKWLLVGLTIFSAIIFVSCSDDDSNSGNGGVDPEEPKERVLTVRTDVIRDVTQTTAICGGTVTDTANLPVLSRGICWSTDTVPTLADNVVQIGTGFGMFATTLSELAGVTKYYVAAYARNSKDTIYGETVVFFTTDSNGTVIDIDGNEYKTVKIGDRWWMAENLKVKHYRNGVSISFADSAKFWKAADSAGVGAYCVDPNASTSNNPYGLLYNWHAVIDTSTIAPSGWHVPDSTEWASLIAHLGGKSIAGMKLKSFGTGYWDSPNDATNESGFSALPGGFRTESGFFIITDTVAAFYSTTPDTMTVVDTLPVDTLRGWGLQLTNWEPQAFKNSKYLLGYGLSIRCVKDAND